VSLAETILLTRFIGRQTIRAMKRNVVREEIRLPEYFPVGKNASSIKLGTGFGIIFILFGGLFVLVTVAGGFLKLFGVTGGHVTYSGNPLVTKIVLFIAGILMVAGGVVILKMANVRCRKEEKLAQYKESFPDKPWLWDFEWEPTGVSSLAKLPEYPRIQFDKFPFFLGETMGLTLTGLPAEWKKLSLKLKFVKEIRESMPFGDEESTDIRCYQLYLEEIVFDSSESSATGRLSVQFPLPREKRFANKLDQNPLRYWQLEVVGVTTESFLNPFYVLPVYAGPLAVDEEE